MRRKKAILAGRFLPLRNSAHRIEIVFAAPDRQIEGAAQNRAVFVDGGGGIAGALQFVQELPDSVGVDFSGAAVPKSLADLWDVIFELAAGVPAVLFPPVVQKIGESDPIVLPAREISSFGNLRPAFGEQLFGEFEASLARALADKLAVLIEVADIPGAVAEVNTPSLLRGHAIRGVVTA